MSASYCESGLNAGCKPGVVPVFYLIKYIKVIFYVKLEKIEKIKFE